MTMTTAPPAVACVSSSMSLPSRSSPSSRALAASLAWVLVVFSTWSTRCSYHSQANDPARVRRMTPIITAFKSVRRHLIGKCSSPPQRVARLTHVPGFICSCLFFAIQDEHEPHTDHGARFGHLLAASSRNALYPSYHP